MTSNSVVSNTDSFSRLQEISIRRNQNFAAREKSYLYLSTLLQVIQMSEELSLSFHVIQMRFVHIYSCVHKPKINDSLSYYVSQVSKDISN